MWVIVASLAVATMFQAYVTYKLVQLSTKGIVNAIQELDGALAEAITEVVEGGLGNFEPPNPLLAILADYMRSSLNTTTAEVTVIDRDKDGKFISNKE
jgi:hypothetical protein